MDDLILEEKFDVQFEDTEENFLYGWGVNRGYSLTFSKVNRCLFLSAEAKQLYNNLRAYAFRDKHWCDPSTEVLRFELGWSKNTLNTKLKELVDAKLIRVDRSSKTGIKFNKNVYRMLPLNKSTIIKHSEIIHQLKPSGFNALREFHAKFKEYKLTDLCEAVNQSDDPSKYILNICKWFKDEGVEYESYTNEAEESEHPLTQVNNPSAELWLSLASKQISTANDGEKRSENERRKPPKLTEIDAIPLEEWNSIQFIELFKRLVKAKKGWDYRQSVSEKIQLGNLVKSYNDNKLVKTLMERYIANADVFGAISISNFTTNYIQNKLKQMKEVSQAEESSNSDVLELFKEDE